MSNGYKDWVLGQSDNTVAKTITMTDVSFFRQLSGWPELNDEMDRIPELHITMSSIGLMTRLGFLEGNLIAVTGNEWKYLKKAYIGDTIRVSYEVLDVKVTGKRLDKEIIAFVLKTFNQKNELIAEGKWQIIMKKPM